MTAIQNELWNNIRNFELDEPDSSLSFTDRLARENGWTIEYSIRTIHEYKKFIFLLCISEKSLTPSDQVDQVWHLHLLYTKSYWIEMCQNVLQKEIHHGPTKGGDLESTKYYSAYLHTKDLYNQLFQEVCPDDIWPSAEIRFSGDFQRVNRDNFWVVKKLSIFNK